MKFRWLLWLWVGAMLAPLAAQGQVSFYGEFSGSRLTNLVSSDTLYGASTGMVFDAARLLHVMILSGDIQGRFVSKSGESLKGVTFGPRVSLPLRHGLDPYGEFMVGFARYNNPNNGGATTDSTLQLNVGLEKAISPHFDLVGEYSYAQYYGLGGQYNPKTFSLGAVYHLTKR